MRRLPPPAHPVSSTSRLLRPAAVARKALLGAILVAGASTVHAQAAGPAAASTSVRAYDVPRALWRAH